MNQWFKGAASIMLIALMCISLIGCMPNNAASAETSEASSPAVETSETPQDTANASASEKATESAESQMTIGYATKSNTNTGWVLINNGAQQAADDYGVNLMMLGPPKDNDIAGQLGVVEDMINNNVDALAIAPCDSAGIVSAVEKANDKNIPVVAIDTGIAGGKVASWVATDNEKAAALGGEWMGDQLGGKGTVVMINGMIAQETGAARRNGFYNAITAKYPDIKIYEVASDWDATKALSGMEDSIQALDQIDGVFCAWDGGTIAILPALEQAGIIDKVVLLGFDSDPNVLSAMKKGKVKGDVAQYLFQIGYKGIETAIKAAKGEEVEPRIDTGTMVVTPENVDQFISDNGLSDYMPK